MKVTLVPGSFSTDPIKSIWLIWEQSRCDDSMDTMIHRFNRLMRGDNLPESDFPTGNEHPAKRFHTLLQMGVPIFQFLHFTFLLEDMHVSFREQLVRHKVGTRVGPQISFDDIPDLATSTFWSQTSRVRNLDHFATKGNYYIPPEILNHKNPKVLQDYRDTMYQIEDSYRLLLEYGLLPEVAREVMPVAMTHRMCFVGSTSVSLLDGTERTLSDLYKDGGYHYFYSSDGDGKVVPGGPAKVEKTGFNQQLVKVTLDSGAQEKCTPDHLWMLSNGEYIRADELKSGERLMPLYRGTNDEGYEECLQDTGWKETHKLASGRRPDDNHTVRHHKDLNKRNNRPDNLEWMNWVEHKRLHGKAAGERLTKAIWSDPEFRERHAKRASERMKALNRDPEFIAKRNAALERNRLPKEERIALINTKEAQINARRKKCLRIAEEIIEAGELVSRDNWELFKYCGFPNTHPSYDTALELIPELCDPNHTVLSVEYCDPEDVYCVVDCGPMNNFALTSGVFVHNCWHANGMTLKNVCRDRSCWIAQAHYWHPVIRGIVRELVQLDPAFYALSTPPCIDKKSDKFDRCPFSHENERRLPGRNDPGIPCVLWAHYQDERELVTDDTEYAILQSMKEDFRLLWGRDVVTGERVVK